MAPSTWKLATVSSGIWTGAAIIVDDAYYSIEARTEAAPLASVPRHVSMMDILGRWAEWQPVLEAIAERLSDRPSSALSMVVPQAPVPQPRKVFCAGANYASHVREMGTEPPDKAVTNPYFFLKPPTAIIGPDEPIVIPPMAQNVDWEVELAAYIGTRAKNVPLAEASDYVAGYTILNDISARDTHKREDWGQGPFYWDWLQSKGCDTFAPTGPFLVPRSQIRDVYNLRLTLSVNGEMMQDSNTDDLIFNVEEQIAYLSSFITLEPGDIISTGTPPGVGMPRGVFLQRGDEVIATIDQIGTLRNPVR
jgi:2,4-diketo-3-deoxy-L-fuconate hydrolase